MEPKEKKILEKVNEDYYSLLGIMGMGDLPYLDTYILALITSLGNRLNCIGIEYKPAESLTEFLNQFEEMDELVAIVTAVEEISLDDDYGEYSKENIERIEDLSIELESNFDDFLKRIENKTLKRLKNE